MAFKSCPAASLCLPAGHRPAPSAPLLTPLSGTLLNTSVSPAWVAFQSSNLRCTRQSKASFTFFFLKHLCAPSALRLPTEDKSELLCLHSRPGLPVLLTPSAAVSLKAPSHTLCSGLLNSLLLSRFPCSVPSAGNPFSLAPPPLFLNRPSLKAQVQRHLMKAALPSLSLMASPPLALGQHCLVLLLPVDLP